MPSRNRRQNPQFLDRILPLADASHDDVVAYTVAVPMRFAECLAVLQDGRRLRMPRPLQFLGWSGSHDAGRLLFRINSRFLLLDGRNGSYRILDDDALSTLPGFTARDGSLVTPRVRRRRYTRRWRDTVTSTQNIGLAGVATQT